MKKNFLLFGLSLTTLALQAQDFGIIGVAIYNVGNFIGENADSSKGIKNIIKYVVFLLIVVAIYQFIKVKVKL